MRSSLPGSPQRALSQALFPFSVAMVVGMAAGNVMVHTALFFYWWVFTGAARLAVARSVW